ncbi:MAG: CoA-binding protein [Peptococcaceae bacterium]
MFSNPNDTQISSLLKNSTTIAVVGISDNPERDSYKVAEYLQKQGYKIIPINPAVKEVLGEKTYSGLTQVSMPVDIVDVFRRSEKVPEVIKEALKLRPKAIWLQLGVINEEATKQAVKEGLTVIMDRCIKIEHNRLLG